MKTCTAFARLPLFASTLLLGAAHPLYAATNYSLNLSGGSQYVQVAANPNFGLNQLTFEAWVYPTAAKCNTIVSRGDGSTAATDYIFQVGYDGVICGGAMKIGFFGAG